MKRAVIIGGATTSYRSLEPVANAVCDLGLADDAEIFPFPKVMDRETELRQASRRALIITNSAGIMAVTKSVQPDKLVAVNGPEPRNVGRLLLAAQVKLAGHYRQSRTGSPDAARYSEIMQDNLSLAAREFRGHLKQLRPMLSFSTISHLAAARDDGQIDVAAIRTTGDTYFPHDPLADTFDIPLYTPEGGHDALMLNPTKILQVLTDPQ